jgi:hypothetical protein
MILFGLLVGGLVIAAVVSLKPKARTSQGGSSGYYHDTGIYFHDGGDSCSSDGGSCGGSD